MLLLAADPSSAALRARRSNQNTKHPLAQHAESGSQSYIFCLHDLFMNVYPPSKQ